MSATRILVVRTGALGDVVHTMPLASALRRHRPDARIGWLVERRLAPLLRGHPAVDDVLEIALADWRREPFATATRRAVASFWRVLDAFAPEIVIDAMGNHKSAALAALSGADRRIGAARRDRREPSSALWISEPVALVGAHAVDRAMSLLAGLGISDRSVDFGAAAILRGPPAATATPPVLIHPGAGWRNKEYPPERWGRVAGELAAARGLEVGVLAGPGEEELAAEVGRAAGGAARVVPALTLEGLAAHLRGARILLAGDTGPLHLAAALGTPVVCVLGPTDPARNGAYGAPESNVAHPLPCSFCYKRLDAPKACLLAIEPGELVARAGLVLDRVDSR
ncbi:MAG: lipopolysaccharide heptosyltransferase I [Acidobacteriota bacterium]|nr:lipopolysaccharide heptosyltransferase I [Acidobacteriota bacterium]MDH3522422.1 lipopolysaccharide heptosyltransferase I [Acidobacteriota bacterium]